MNVGVCHVLYIALIQTWSYGVVGMLVMFGRL